MRCARTTLETLALVSGIKNATKYESDGLNGADAFAPCPSA